MLKRTSTKNATSFPILNLADALSPQYFLPRFTAELFQLAWYEYLFAIEHRAIYTLIVEYYTHYKIKPKIDALIAQVNFTPETDSLETREIIVNTTSQLITQIPKNLLEEPYGWYRRQLRNPNINDFIFEFMFALSENPAPNSLKKSAQFVASLLDLQLPVIRYALVGEKLAKRSFTSTADVDAAIHIEYLSYLRAKIKKSREAKACQAQEEIFQRMQAEAEDSVDDLLCELQPCLRTDKTWLRFRLPNELMEGGAQTVISPSTGGQAYEIAQATDDLTYRHSEESREVFAKGIVDQTSCLPRCYAAFVLCRRELIASYPVDSAMEKQLQWQTARFIMLPELSHRHLFSPARLSVTRLTMVLLLPFFTLLKWKSLISQLMFNKEMVEKLSTETQSTYPQHEYINTLVSYFNEYMPAKIKLLLTQRFPHIPETLLEKLAKIDNLVTEAHACYLYQLLGKEPGFRHQEFIEVISADITYVTFFVLLKKSCVKSPSYLTMAKIMLQSMLGFPVFCRPENSSHLTSVSISASFRNIFPTIAANDQIISLPAAMPLETHLNPSYLPVPEEYRSFINPHCWTELCEIMRDHLADIYTDCHDYRDAKLAAHAHLPLSPSFPGLNLECPPLLPHLPRSISAPPAIHFFPSMPTPITAAPPPMLPPSPISGPKPPPLVLEPEKTIFQIESTQGKIEVHLPSIRDRIWGGDIQLRNLATKLIENSGRVKKGIRGSGLYLSFETTPPRYKLKLPKGSNYGNVRLWFDKIETQRDAMAAAAAAAATLPAIALVKIDWKAHREK